MRGWTTARKKIQNYIISIRASTNSYCMHQKPAWLYRIEDVLCIIKFYILYEFFFCFLCVANGFVFPKRLWNHSIFNLS